MKKFIIFVSLLFSFGLAFCDDEKIKAIFEETEAKVQEILTSDKVHENRKQFEINAAVSRGKKKLEDLRSFYVVRHAFADAERVKKSLDKFTQTDFKKATVAEEVPQEVVVKNDMPREGEPAEKKPKNTKTDDQPSAFAMMRDFETLPSGEKDALVKKVVQQTPTGFFRIESNNFILEGNHTAHEMVRAIIWLERTAYLYSAIFDYGDKKLKEKVSVLHLKKDAFLDDILKEKKITIPNERMGSVVEFYDKETKTYVLVNMRSFVYIRQSLVDALVAAMVEPFKNRHNYARSLLPNNEPVGISLFKKDVLFSSYMTNRRDDNALTNGDHATFKKEIVAGGFSGKYSNFRFQFAVYLIQNGDFENLHLLSKKEGDNFFKKPEANKLLDGFVKFYEKEAPLADYCRSILNSLRFGGGTSEYRGRIENEEKLIVIEAKYKHLPMANYFKGVHYYLCQEYDKAVSAMLSLKDDIDRYPMVYSVLAVSYFNLGKINEAKIYKKKALADSHLDRVIERFGKKIPD